MMPRMLTEAQIRDQMVCERPPDFELTRERWVVIVAEYKRRKAAGRWGFMYAEEVRALFSREDR